MSGTDEFLMIAFVVIGLFGIPYFTKVYTKKSWLDKAHSGRPLILKGRTYYFRKDKK